MVRLVVWRGKKNESGLWGISKFVVEVGGICGVGIECGVSCYLVIFIIE